MNVSWFLQPGNGSPINGLMQWLASPGWNEVVQALLHTLWEGALVAVVLFIVLRRTVNPVTRHRCCLLAMAMVLLMGLCTWAVLDSRRTVHSSATVPAASVASPTPRTGVPTNAAGTSVTLTPTEVGRTGRTMPIAPTAPPRQWVAWFALAWLAGITLMLLRAARSVAGAEKLRRTARPLQDETMLRLIEEARRKLGLARRIRAVVTDKLTSPAVAGILVPTLILPLSLMTALPTNQLQLIVLHELAHIRRGDYLANLLQLLVESLLFFNPAVWWISRQLRQEREACCDAVAVALAGGERLEYARALARVAEHSLGESLAATPAFADGRDRPGLADRVRRVLAPGARPQLRLTWRALAGSLVFGGAVFLLSALGTQWTVQAAARLLTPQERIARIETDMTDFGQAPENFANNPTNRVEFTIQVRTADGSPRPRLRYLSSQIQTGNFGDGGPLLLDSNEVGKLVLQGSSTAYLGTWVAGYAPARLGPLTASSTNATGHFDLVLDHGFGLTVRVLDLDSGKPVPRAVLSYVFAFLGPNAYEDRPHPATADDDGIVHLTNCASFPLHMHVAMDGYEPGETLFEHLKADDELKIYTRRALPIAGQVRDATSGQPIGGASIYVIHSADAPGMGDVDPWMVHSRYGDTKPNAVGDAGGHFVIDRLPQSGRYLLMAQAAGHASVMLYDARPGQTNLGAALGPEIVVRGRIEGDLSLITDGQGHATIGPLFHAKPDGGTRGTMANNSSFSPQGGMSWNGIVPVRIENGVGYFEFTNLVAGPAEVSIGRPGDMINFTTNAIASVDNWVIKLADADTTPKRQVVIRFQTASKVAPRGTVVVNLPGRMPNWAIRKELELTNGEVQCEALIGRSLYIEPGHTVGFWFDHQGATVEAGSGAQIISVPTVPAGAIYALARNPDGSVASDVLFSVREIKKSPLTPSTLFTLPGGDTLFPGQGPRHYAASPLPLGGTYAIVAYRDNNFSASGPITISDADPDRNVELQMRKGARVKGQVFAPSGQPLTNVIVSIVCNLLGCAYGLNPAQTDETGRFAFDNCDPALGKFTIDISSPGLRGVRLVVDMNKLPLTVHLQPGLKIFGQVIDGKTGKPLPGAIVSVMPASDRDFERLPFGKTVADETGRFELDTLSDADYYVMATPGNSRGLGSGGYSEETLEFRAGGKKAAVIKLMPSGKPN